MINRLSIITNQDTTPYFRPIFLRFEIEEKNRTMASRLIRNAAEAHAIVPYDPTAAPKLMKYVPWWAAPEQGYG
jgi:hypothetical protein